MSHNEHSATAATEGSPAAKGSPTQAQNAKSFGGKGQGGNKDKGGKRPAGQTQRTHQNLFVACLPKGLSNPELLSLFSPYGATSAAVMMDVATGASKGYGFATFSSEEAGKFALDALNHKNVTAGEHTFVITVSPSKHDSKNVIEESNFVYFRNVPSCFIEGTVRDVFARYGRVMQHTMRKDGEKDSLLVMVEYQTVAEAKKAIDLCHGAVMFPQISQIPVMAKFADANVTKALQNANRRPSHPFPKFVACLPKHHDNSRGAENGSNNAPVLVKHTPGRNSPNIGHPNQRATTPNMVLPLPKTQQQNNQQGAAGSAPIAIHHREGSNLSHRDCTPQQSWDNTTPGHSPSPHMTPRQSFQGGDRESSFQMGEGASYHGMDRRHSYHSNNSHGGSYTSHGLPMPTHPAPVYQGPNSHGNSYHDQQYHGNSHPNDFGNNSGNSNGNGYGYGSGHQQQGAYNSSQQHQPDHYHSHGNSYHEQEEEACSGLHSGPMLDGQGVAQMGGAGHHSAGSSLNLRGEGHSHGATFRHDPYSQNGYSIASDY